MSEDIRWTSFMYFLAYIRHNSLRYSFFNLGANFGQMISVNYKTYMKADIMDDRYLTIVGAFGALACSLSRLIWGIVLEK